jgi:uncharacterized protein (TIGR00297 family)
MNQILSVSFSASSDGLLIAGALSGSGALAAAVSGGLIFGLGGFPWAVLLLVFFISSSALSRTFASRKAVLSEKFSKGSRRDWGQVLANGGLGALLAVVHAALPAQNWVWLAFVGAMAAVNADTWATELGVLSRTAPLNHHRKTVESGTSGKSHFCYSPSWRAALIGAAAVIVLIHSGSCRSAGRRRVPGGSTTIFRVPPTAMYCRPACRKERHPAYLWNETIPLGWQAEQ